MGFPYTTYISSIQGSTIAYATGGVIGGLNELYPVPNSGFIQGVVITAKSTVATQIVAIFFGTSMPNTTFTDHSSINISSADTPNCQSVVHVTDWSYGSTACSIGTANGLAYRYTAGTGERQHLWYALVARGALIVNSTADFTVSVTIVS